MFKTREINLEFAYIFFPGRGFIDKLYLRFIQKKTRALFVIKVSN